MQQVECISIRILFIRVICKRCVENDENFPVVLKLEIHGIRVFHCIIMEQNCTCNITILGIISNIIQKNCMYKLTEYRNAMQKINSINYCVLVSENGLN